MPDDKRRVWIGHCFTCRETSPELPDCDAAVNWEVDHQCRTQTSIYQYVPVKKARRE